MYKRQKRHNRVDAVPFPVLVSVTIPSITDRWFVRQTVVYIKQMPGAVPAMEDIWNRDRKAGTM